MLQVDNHAPVPEELPFDSSVLANLSRGLWTAPYIIHESWGAWLASRNEELRQCLASEFPVYLHSSVEKLSQNLNEEKHLDPT